MIHQAIPQAVAPPDHFDNDQSARLGASRLAALATQGRERAVRLRAQAEAVLEAARATLFRDRARRGSAGEEGSEFRAFLRSCKGVFWGLAVFSGMSNLLMLTGSFFMLQVYDRVLPGRSVPTLLALLTLAITLYLFQGGLDLVRARIGARVGRHFDERLGLRVFDALARLPLKARNDGDGMQPLRDLDQLRGFLAGGGPTALLDLPWMPVYLGICFLFHFWIGVTALFGAIALVGLTVIAEIRTQAPTQAFARHGATRTALAAESRRNAESLQAMGMRGQAARRWLDANDAYLEAHQQAGDIASGLGGAARVFRSVLQSVVLAVGAALVINQQSTAGIIIAGSILTARALAPVDVAIANWKGFVAARQAWRRLDLLLKLLPAENEPLALPAPRETLTVEALHVAAPGSERRLLTDISFTLRAGQAVGIIGPSGSGKSTLARALVGVWPRLGGRVKLDNAALDQWSSEALGKHVGYLPQDVELFAGSIARNIGRFQANIKAADVLKAAKAAGVHDLILSFPEGYGTRIGEGGVALSAGQRQRIGLARALYGEPFLVVLDEPSSNLDGEGEEALNAAIAETRARGGIVVIVAHRPKALESVDHVLVIGSGQAQAFGPKDEVLNRVLRKPVALNVVANNSAAGKWSAR
jgi:PrtD family type I secretion system ABC transporter